MKSSVVSSGKVSVFVLAAAITACAWGQSLPTPSRTVYKCAASGKTVYSDSPCMGAQGIEVEPSRGIGKNAGTDVQREQHREMFAEAIRPLAGMNAKQLDAHGRRLKLSPEAQRECRDLDAQIPQLEVTEASHSGAQRDTASVRLLSLRQRHRYLRC